jgi:hypothetical protein
MQWRARLIAGCALLSLGFGSTTACGDDDDEGPTRRDGGPRSNAPADGGKRPPIVVTPRQAIAGACLVQLIAGPDHFNDCTGLDQLEACARRQCDLETCIDQCTQYMTCLYESSTACDPTCYPEDGCGSCMATVTQCIFSGTCLDTFECVEQIEGGRCDELRACCGEQQGELRQQCMQVAEATAAAQGEMACSNFLNAVAMFAGAVPCN